MLSFSPEGSHVLLEVKPEPKEVRFTVRDQGIGIAKKDHDLIFESFRQVEGGETRRFGGTGLGLAIAKTLVELHGGRIRINSDLGQGSEFIIELPRQGMGDQDLEIS